MPTPPINTLELVETLLDDAINPADKREIKQACMRRHRIPERTIRGYVHKYRKKGSRGLLFRRPRPPCPRVTDPGPAAKIISLVKELPCRSVPQLRRLLCAHDAFREKITAVSDRTIYRFLAENGLGHAQRCRLGGERKRDACHAFTAPRSLALVQGDARDGIRITRPDGKRIKTFLFPWIDDYSRRILFGKYYTNEKLPCMEDSFRHMVLRWGIPLKIHLDNGKVKLFGNIYPVSCVPYGTMIRVRFDPFDLVEIYIYGQQDHFREKTRPGKQVTRQVKSVPEESKKTKREISQDSVRYSDRLRREHLRMQKQSGRIDFSAFSTKTRKETEDHGDE